jgi:WD40 repeat protein
MLKYCYHHNLPITSLCTYSLCDCLFLCDICLNDHNKTHKYTITVDLLKSNFLEKTIIKNSQECKKLRQDINDAAEDYISKIEYNFEVYVTNFMDVIEKCKQNLIEKVETLKNTKLEELEIWGGLLNQYQKAYREFIHNDVFNITFEDDSKLIKQNLFDSRVEENMLEQSLFDRNVYMNNMLNVINTLMENHLYHFNTDKSLLDDYNSSVKQFVNDGLADIKKDFKDMLERFSFDEREQGGLQGVVRGHKRSPTGKTTGDIKTGNPLTLSPFRMSLQSHTQPNIDFHNLSISKVDLVISDKKGAWYTCEYIEEYDYIVCGYQTGEIIIFKESDLTLIKTYRPRTKRIRKIIYSAANSSIFASYDDGYVVIITLDDFKIHSFKMSESQIYTMEILQNENILVFGGVDKKIFYAQIINLKQINTLYTSEHGEIQSMYYEEKRDILVAGLRKSHIVFISFKNSNVVFKHEFKGFDCCAMNIKKYKDDIILSCGYFMNVNLFKFQSNTKIEHIGVIELKVSHIYDVLRLDENFILASTFDDDKLILYDMEKKRVTRLYENFRGALQLNIIKSGFYLTSHSESLKKIVFK